MGKIEKLKKRVDEQREQRQIAEETDKIRYESQRDIEQAPKFCRKMFYCEECDTDYETLAGKVVFSWEGQILAKYIPIKKAHKGKNGICTRDNFRQITEVALDPYWNKSKLIKQQRKKYAKDLLQPGEYGFKTLYGDK